MGIIPSAALGIQRIAFIGAIAGDGDAGGIVRSAFGMLVTTHFSGAFIRTFSVDFDTLILIIACQMRFCAAPNERITLIGTISGNGDTCRAIVTFSVFVATY
jgi:hypothetical protein